MSSLSSLSGLAAKLGVLEQQAELLAALQAEQLEETECGLLQEAQHVGCSSRSQQQQQLARQVSELKAFIRAFADAELDGDASLLAITAGHTARHALRLLRAQGDLACMPSKGAQLVGDLAAATLCMLSQRPAAHEALAAAGAIPALLSLLDPLASACAVDNAAKALGNLSADAACRAVVRSNGGVGALARMLRGDCPGVMQAAAAASLALLCARDGIVQDSLRYLGALPLLVAMLNSHELNVAEAGRCCLCALKHKNARNTADILAALRSDAQLAKDYWRLKDALQLLDEAPPGCLALAGSKAAKPTAISSSVGGGVSITSGRIGGGKASSAAAVRAMADHVLQEAQDEVAAAAAQVAEAVEEEVLARKIRRAQRPADELRESLDASIALLQASLAESKAAAAVRKAASAVNMCRPASAAAVRCSQRASCGSSSKLLPAAARTAQSRHLMRYSCDELMALLSAVGFDAGDLLPLRRSGLNGAQLLLLDDADIACLTGLPKHKTHRLRRLQDAARLYDTIAARACQGKLTDVELRLWLAAQGCSASESGRVMKLLRSLVVASGDPYAPAVCMWDWAVGWSWVMHALEVYGVDWRA